MTKWTPEEDDAITKLAGDGLSAKEIARTVPPRSESAVSSRLSRIGVSLESREHQTLREYLAEGGRLVREEIGGAVGVHWAKATRCGVSFSTQVCERFVELGFIRPDAGRENIFRWSDPA